MINPDGEAELERQIECAGNRMRILAGRREKGSMTVHFDGSGFIGKNFTENFTICRDLFSSEKMGRQIDEEELKEALAGGQTISRAR